MKHEIKKFKQGDLIYKEGDEDRTLYLLKQGRAQLFNTINETNYDGTMVHSGSVIGELSFFDGKPRETSVKAIMNCVTIAIRFEDMQKQIEAIPPWFTTIINSIVGRVRNTEQNVVKVASKGSSMDYSKKDRKADNYTYMDKKDFIKIATVLSMVTAKYSRKGVSSFEVNYDALKQFVVRFQLGTSKLNAVLDVLQEHELGRVTEMGEGKTKLEILDIDKLDGLVKSLTGKAGDIELSQDAVRALNALEKYLKEEPVSAEGRRRSNIVKVQNDVLAQEKYFLQQAAFKILAESGLIKNESEDVEKLIDFSFDPKEVSAFLPTQKILASLETLNKEH